MLAGNPLRPDPDFAAEDELAAQVARAFWYADRFGWTPDQVDQLPAFIEARLPDVADVVDELRREAQERSAKARERKR